MDTTTKVIIAVVAGATIAFIAIKGLGLRTARTRATLQQPQTIIIQTPQQQPYYQPRQSYYGWREGHSWHHGH